jgi:hypothetical protein
VSISEREHLLRTISAYLVLSCRPSNPIAPLYLSLYNLDSLIARMVPEVLEEDAACRYREMYCAYVKVSTSSLNNTRIESPLTYLNPYTRGFLIPIEHADDLANDKRDEAVEVEEVENQSYCDTDDSNEKKRREHGCDSWVVPVGEEQKSLVW